METRKLYYEDCMLRQFTARVQTCQSAQKGWLVTLDATAFYPEGGGQACDLGTLGEARVLDVQEKEDQVLHLCDRPLEVGSQVLGCIDWQRRFDLMQQHAGEHIVSGIIFREFGHHNVGFHMGKETMEIDFDGPIPADALNRIELLANQAVWEDLPIRCWYPSREELATLSYRTKKALPWPVRIVQIPGVDQCACCGVHTATTGQIGLIKLVSCIKFHQGVRIQLICGGRALALTQAIFEQNRQVSNAFSAKMLETGAAARRMNEVLAAEKLRGNLLQGKVFDAIADGCTGKTNVVHFAEGLEPAGVRTLADKMAQRCSGWAAVLSGGQDSYHVCILSAQADVAAIGKALTGRFGGRGGGRNGCFQGSIGGKEEDIRQFFRENA